ncbi:MAG: hypothetical protein HQK99_14005 [Nitrospirae bacterium]|nr:hypothetical protein [Nitrospirota bacterium]
MKPHRLKFIASSLFLLTVLSYMVFEYVPYFNYKEQQADITQISASGVSDSAIYDIRDFNPVIANISPVSQDDCKLKSCGESFNWSVRTYADKDDNYKITIKITRHQSREKAMRDFDEYVLSIRKNRFDKTVQQGDCRIFISGVKKLRRGYSAMPTGLFASRVLLLKNNIILDVLETSKSKRGEYKNAFLAGLGGQLMAASASGGK